MSNDKKSYSLTTFGVQKGPKATSVDQQLIEWARKTEDHIMHVMTSYVTADGKVNQSFLRGVLLSTSLLKSLKERKLNVELRANLKTAGSLLPKPPPETGDAEIRQYYQRLRDADLALLREITSKLNKAADAHEARWVAVGKQLTILLFESEDLNLYRTPQQLMMNCAAEMDKWMEGKGPAFAQEVRQQWKTIFDYLHETVLAERPDIRDAVKRRGTTIKDLESLMAFFQEAANEIETVMEKLRMFEELLGITGGLGKRAVETDLSADSTGTEGSGPEKVRRRVLQPSTTKADTKSAENKKAGGKPRYAEVPCSYLVATGYCKNEHCPFAHDESKLPDDKRQQLVPAGQKDSEKEKKKGYEFKRGGCSWCWMPHSNAEFKNSHGADEKYSKSGCPYKDLQQGSKKERK